jgi:hypothetical protein
MIQTILTFLAAFLLSGIAGYYSIVGLALIFPGAFWPVVIMGGALEFSKLVTASWLYRNWKTSPFLLKSYLTTAVVVLMLITSMGIFGFLSKAHIEHTTESAPIYDKVALYDEQISTKKSQIEDNKKAIKQMDESVDQLMNRTTDDKGANRAVQVRKSQQKERARLTNENLKLQKEISEVNEQKSPIMAEMRKNEADIGPIKYVAELIYGTSDSGIVDKAVRLVIMIIMLVFDPLAVLLLIAGNISIGRKNVNTFELENDIPIFTPNTKEAKIKKNKIRKPKVSKSVEVETSNIATIYDAAEKIEDARQIEEIHQAEGLFTTQPKG